MAKTFNNKDELLKELDVDSRYLSGWTIYKIYLFGKKKVPIISGLFFGGTDAWKKDILTE